MDFFGGFITNTARVDTLDQLTLPMDSSVDSVSVHIAYGDKYTVSFLSYMVRLDFGVLLIGLCQEN